MTYEQRQPPPSLDRYVRYFWTLEGGSVDGTPTTFGPLADGCPGLIFQRADAGQFHDQDGKQLPELFLYGQTIKRTALHLTGYAKTVGICFVPNALKSIFGFNANELTDSCLDMALLWPNLAEQLLTTPSVAGQVAWLSGYLTDQIRKTGTPVDAFTHYALSQLIDTKGNVSLKQMQHTLNLSERSIERRFEQQVGISPKLYARVCRFQASLSQLQRNDYGKLSDVAFENGYADQSHFIRVFREFTGHSPRHFQKQRPERVDNSPVIIR